jgi:hypothetical protein
VAGNREYPTVAPNSDAKAQIFQWRSRAGVNRARFADRQSEPPKLEAPAGPKLEGMEQNPPCSHESAPREQNSAVRNGIRRTLGENTGPDHWRCAQQTKKTWRRGKPRPIGAHAEGRRRRARGRGRTCSMCPCGK